MRMPKQRGAVMRLSSAVPGGREGIEMFGFGFHLPSVPVPGRKHTYCCKFGPGDDPERHCRQFRATSVQASLFCLRFAKGCSDCGSGTAGRLSRGECDC
jgi:hypothetical protein